MTDWQSWSPNNTPHVDGRYESYRPGQAGGRLVQVSCRVCGATLNHVCRNNNPRSHIALFAARHLDCPKKPQKA